MRMKLFAWGFLVAGLLMACGGCGKAGGDPHAAAPAPQTAPPIARLHWVGKERLGADTNAAYLMSLWRMPEAARLEARTLDKLALAPWRLTGQTQTNLASRSPAGPLPTNSGLSTLHSPLSTNSPLRPLLEDVLLKESYLEARQAGTNGPVELAFAIRLTPERAVWWQSNLATVFASLTGTRPTPTPTGWELTPAAASTSAFSLQPLALSASHVQLTRAGDWTLLLLGGSAALSNSLLSTLNHPLSTNWLEAELDLARLPSPWSVLASSNLSTLHAPRSTNIPRLSLRLSGDGRNVHTLAELNFPRPLGLQLEPWNVPTNLVHEPLIGFLAVRGLRPWLAAAPWWSELGLGTPPNQAYFWAQHGMPRFHHMAAPSAEASNQVVKLSAFLLEKVNPILTNAPMKLGMFQKRANAPGVVWYGYQLLSPNLAYTNFGENPFFLAGFSATAPTNGPMPAALLQELYANTNLVWYDWELTGECTAGLAQLAQLGRHLSNRARLTHTPALEWLMAAGLKLGPSVTGAFVTGPNRLTLRRTSSIGMNGMELQVFIDWLASPEFPLGLHTLLAAPQPPSAPSATNASHSGAETLKALTR